jgi:hypothetical protein
VLEIYTVAISSAKQEVTLVQISICAESPSQCAERFRY